MEEICEITIHEAARLLERLVSERKVLEKAAGALKHLASLTQATQEGEARIAALTNLVAGLVTDRDELVDLISAKQAMHAEWANAQTAALEERVAVASAELQTINTQIGEAKAARLNSMEELQLLHEGRVESFQKEEQELSERVAELRDSLASLQRQAAAIAHG